MSNNNFGIDLLFESQKNNIRNNSDVLMILVHWVVTKNGFRCVGIGDNKVYQEEDRLSELLPEEWNINPQLYVLRYALKKQIYILYGIRSDDLLILNFLDPKLLKVSNLILNVDKLVKSKSGQSLDDYMNESQTIIERLESKVVKPILEETTERTAPKPSSPVNRAPQQQPPFSRLYEDNRRIDPLRDIGRGDLDPFGRGGGMLFRPDHGEFGGIGPGPMRPHFGVPPGARFDPINPLRRSDPDPDHLPPTGYDDMFM